MNHRSKFRFILPVLMFLELVTAGCGKEPKASPTVPYSAEEDEGSSSVSIKDEESEEATPGPSKSPNEGGMKTGSTASSPSPIPSPAAVSGSKSQVKVKGIYVSASNMNGSGYANMVKLVQKTDLNAMVIDVKNDSGQVTFPSSVELVKAIKADAKPYAPDMAERLKRLKAQNIYTIGRIVVFKDPYLAAKKPAYAMQKKTGGVWRDPKGISWVDPFQQKVWDYNLSIAEEAARLGFDEIQFDYVRFPDNAKRVDQEVQFQNANGSAKAEAIRQFLAEARKRLPNTTISADVFGLTTSAKDDMGIGQKWELLAPVIDVISPMVYPSHYSKGMYGVASPDLKPYSIISKAMSDASARNTSIKNGGSTPARIRPWLQDFTATWVKPHQTYSSKQVQEQIRAAAEQGIDEFLLWNPSGKYSYR